MTESVFTNDYLEFELAQAKADAAAAASRVILLEVLMAAGHALHANFISGEEAKWTHSAQRESLLELSAACKRATGERAS